MKPAGLKRLAAVVAALALAGGVTACGGDDDGGGGDGVAGAAPVDSAVYFEATVRPEGDQLAAIESVAARFPNGEDLGTTITSAIDQSVAEDSPDFSYEEDVEPWLGERAGFFFMSFEGDDPDGAAIVEVTDEDAAREAIAKAAEGEGGTQELGGEEVTIDEDGDASLVKDGRLIAGTEAGVEAALGAGSGDEDDLSGSDDFDESFDRVGGDDALGYLQVDIARAIEEAGKAGSAEPDQVQTFLDQVGIDPEGTFSMSVSAEDDAVRSNFALPFDAPGDTSSRGLVDDVPADSLLAFGTAEFGAGFSQGFDAGFEQSAANAGASEEEIEEARGQVERALGIDPSELDDVLGDLGFFVRGSSLDDLQAGALLAVEDTARIQEALTSARSTLGTSVAPLTVEGAEDAFSIVQPDSLDQPVEIALAGDRLALGYGSGSATAALAPTEKLGDSDALAAAGDALGGDAEPSFFLDVQRGLTLLEATGAFDAEPDYSQVRPYLAPLGVLTSGVTGDEDGILLTSLALTLTEGGVPIEPAAPGEDPAAAAPEPTAPTPAEPPAGGQAQATEGDAAERDITNNLREFNAVANSGNALQACNRFFSQAFLARLQSERQCANSIASARAGGGKTQIDVAFVNLDPITEGQARAVVRFGPGPLGQDQREIDLIYESGLWKIDAVNTL